MTIALVTGDDGVNMYKADDSLLMTGRGRWAHSRQGYIQDVIFFWGKQRSESLDPEREAYFFLKRAI